MMFYTQLFASKGAPLAKIWLAAHWERKISKDNVNECNLESTIEDIISPQVSIGLRTSSHLLVGVVRIYSKKAKYLLADCSEALVKIKVAFRPGQIDMCAEGFEASMNAIAWIENLPDLDADMSMDTVDHSLNQSGKEKITLKEDFGNHGVLVTLQGFGDGSHQSHGQLDITYESLADPGDSFGDEASGMSVLDWMTSSGDYAILETTDNSLEEQRLNRLLENLVNDEPMEVNTPTVNEKLTIGRKRKEKTTRKRKEQSPAELSNEVFRQMAVDYCNLSKRKPLVEQSCELDDDDFYQLIADYSDMIETPPKRSKETSKAAEERRSFSTKVLHQGLQQLFPRDIDALVARGRNDSTLVQSSVVPTRSALESQECLEERRLARKTQKLLNTLRSQSGSGRNDATFSFKSLCERSSRTQASETFYHLLALKKQQAVQLHQNAPYEDVLATPGPQFHKS